METQLKVVLIGDSLLIAGVEVSLREQPGMDVIRVDIALPDAGQRLGRLQPDVLIFDLAASQSPFSDSNFPASILQEHPGMSLIGIDPSSNNVLVLSGEERTVMAANDLAHVIQTLAR